MEKNVSFLPEHRHSLVDALRPPENYVVEAAVGTAYSLDFDTLTAILLGFLDLDPDLHDETPPAGKPQTDGPKIGLKTLQSLRAISRFSEHLRVYVNHGYIRPRRRHNPLFQFYDRMVRQVSFLKNKPPCSFHPKVWVLKYRSTQSLSPRFRLLVQSRNLTQDHLWDMAVMLEGEPTSREFPIGREVSSFVRQLTKMPQEDTRPVPERVLSLIEELPRVNFRLGNEIQKCEFLWQAPNAGRIMLDRLSNGEEALVISPFLDDEFISNLLLDRFDNLTLISTRQALDELSEQAFLRLAGNSASGKNKIYVIEEGIFEDENDPNHDSGDSRFQLHAKFYLFENRKGTECLLGSANASRRGWGRNCEAMLTVSPGIPIRKFCNEFLFKESGKTYGFVSEYTERDYGLVDRDEKEKELKARHAVEAIREAICLLGISQHYNRKERKLSLMATDPGANGALRKFWPKDIRVNLCPLGFLERYQMGLPLLADVFTPLGLVLSGCSIKDLTEFVHCSVQAVDGTGGTEFIVKTNTDFKDLMRVRDEDLRKSILSRATTDDLLRLIIFGSPRLHSVSESNLEGRKSEGIGRGLSRILGDLVTIEDVLRACTEDPDRIGEIDQLLKDLGDADVDPAFMAFWNEFKAASN
jgi:hypothetical protein